jgi:galactokinase/mevalonate kinase-like predicted kinase
VLNIKAPFRLDMVMGGVSDLVWWNDMSGDCLSVSCDFIDTSIDITVELLLIDNVFISGFGKNINDNLSISLKDLDKDIVNKCPKQFKLIISSLVIAKNIIESNGSLKLTNGFRVINSSSRVKGMGGSSVVAASIISLLCYSIGKLKLSLQEIVNAVVDVEDLAGIGGGWEDVAGIYNSGINWIQYRPEKSTQLSISNISLSNNIYETLSKRLLVVDTQIEASTEKILKAAEINYKQNEQLVIDNSNLIRNECEIVCEALKNSDFDEIGHSLLRQRKAWNYITSGNSANKNIDSLMNQIKPFTIGYREAGAGGGGTLLVMCKAGKIENITNFFIANNYILKPWKVSEYGLSANFKNK